jgi:hypothetical protein
MGQVVRSAIASAGQFTITGVMSSRLADPPVSSVCTLPLCFCCAERPATVMAETLS